MLVIVKVRFRFWVLDLRSRRCCVLFTCCDFWCNVPFVFKLRGGISCVGCVKFFFLSSLNDEEFCIEASEFVP